MVNLAPVVIAIRSARADYAYGQLATLPANTTSSMLARVGLPAAVSEDAVIASATLVLTQVGGGSGSVAVSLRRLVAGFNVSRTTWSNAPALTGSTVTVTKSSPATGTQWSFDVTADLQGIAAGSLENFGWRITSTSVAGVRFRGSSASSGQPVLVLDFVEPGEAPDDLYPNGGVVSLAKPTLSFLVAPDTTAVQVQVDADATSTYDFDSGEITSDVGQIVLSSTAYAGLSSGASTFWRARSRGATGLTPWSAWASFSRTTKPTVAVVSPGATSDDVSPPVIWSVSGGTQESWRVIVTNGAGNVVADSGRVASSATTWIAPKNLIRMEGGVGTIEVRVWDNVDRAVTPGDPEYAVATSTYTLSTTGGVTAPATVDATSNGFSPKVVVSATAVSAPDGWAVIRDGERVYTDPTHPTATFSWTDWNATPNHEHDYRVARIVGGAVSSGGPHATVVPKFSGLWLVDPEDGTVAVLWGNDEGSWSAAELAITHQPIAGPPIRRVAYRPPMSGSISGELVDVQTISADDSIEVLYEFKSSPADRELRLFAGDRSLLVNVGDITVYPAPLSGDERWSRASFSWWQVDDVPWSP